ncbi:MAG TPA: acetyl-CoA carboxylase biotin carboxyl carrier protein [Alphaproteobacteria bacterium]|nr:acetyl-CoA carboxylase biotin carboxyl carrier protein [Alphaproteobacteria bacterium]
MPPFDIDADAIRKLAQLMTETGLAEIELAEGERRMRVARAVVQPAALAPIAAVAPAHHAESVTAAPNAASLAAHPGAVTSPMVGTAYLQPEPEAQHFVEVGDTVRVGDTLLIIEAMKVMNPIKAPKAGTVTQILVSDGQPVEYGEPLMLIE